MRGGGRGKLKVGKLRCYVTGIERLLNDMAAGKSVQQLLPSTPRTYKLKEDKKSRIKFSNKNMKTSGDV